MGVIKGCLHRLFPTLVSSELLNFRTPTLLRRHNMTSLQTSQPYNLTNSLIIYDYRDSCVVSAPAGILYYVYALLCLALDSEVDGLCVALYLLKAVVLLAFLFESTDEFGCVAHHIGMLDNLFYLPCHFVACDDGGKGGVPVG